MTQWEPSWSVREEEESRVHGRGDRPFDCGCEGPVQFTVGHEDTTVPGGEVSSTNLQGEPVEGRYGGHYLPPSSCGGPRSS